MRIVTPLVGVLCLLLSLTPAAWASKPQPEGTKKATILSTSSVGGETKSCGCKKKDLGGLSRRAALIAEQRAENPDLLLVDAGDFGTDKNPGLWARTDFQFEMMAKMGYDAATVGSNELLEGVDKIRGVFAKAPQIQVVSANVTDKAGTLYWPAFTVVEKGGIKYGITGVTDGAFYTYNLQRGFQLKDDFAFLDMKEALVKVLPELRKQSDVVVVLLYSGPTESQKLVKELPGIDVAIVGRNPGFAFVPDQIGPAFVVRAGKQGQYVSALNLYRDASGKTVDWMGQSFAIGETVAEDPQIKAAVEAFNAKVEPQEKRSEDKATTTP